MSDKANQCTCSASFPTNEALDDHLTEIRSQEGYHSAQLEKCRTHSRANDDGDGDNVRDDSGDPTPKTKVCPHSECVRTKQFSTRQRLRRHFQQHVTCEEVCVFCFKLFRLASEFMRHAEENHRHARGRKATYMQEMYGEIRCRVDIELDLAESANPSEGVKGGCKKRVWEAAGMDPGTSGTQRIKGVGVMTTNNSQQIIGVTPILPSTQSAMTFVPIPSVGEVATASDIGSFSDISTQMIYPNSVGGSSGGDSYDAPLLQMISSIPYTEDMGWYQRL